MMKYFKTPEFLFEVFGESQSILEVSSTIIFALIGSWIIYSVANIEFNHWKIVVAYLLIADVLAGCIANFSFGTNEFYSKRPKNRLIFIAIHIHILVIAWLLAEPLDTALIVWGYTIASAFFVNWLNGNTMQKFIAANLMCYGIFLLLYLSLPVWFLMVSIFFMIKVLFSFSVNHFDKLDKSNEVS